MQRLLTKYGLVSHLALVVLFPVMFLNPSRVFDLVPLLWLTLVALELMVLLPSVRKGETLADARQRVLRALRWDPFLYIGLAIAGVVLIQWANSGCELVYLPDGDVWQFSQPSVTGVPFSVETRAALAYVSLFSACVVLGLILRVAVSKGAKRLLLQGLTGVSGAVAICAVWQACQGEEPYASLTFAQGAASLGTFFGFWLVLGLGVYVDATARFQRGTRPLFLFGVVGNLLGVLFFASALATAVYGMTAVLLFIYALIYVGPHVAKQVQLKLFLVSLVTVASVVVCLGFVFHGNPVLAKMKAALPADAYWEALSSVKNMRTVAALDIWQDHPWVGVGADGFRHFAGLAVAGKDWALMKNDPSCVYNDSLQFLCEFGVVGFGLLLAAVITLMVPICTRARIAWKYGVGGGNDGRLFLLRLSPIALTGVLATLLCFFESWVANPFRSYGLLLSWTCVMAVLPAFLPARATPAAPRLGG